MLTIAIICIYLKDRKENPYVDTPYYILLILVAIFFDIAAYLSLFYAMNPKII